MLVKNDTRLISGSIDSELRVWGLHFKDEEKEKGEEVKVKEEGAEEPPSKMFRLDTEGEVKREQEDVDEDIKDDAVRK